MTDKTSSSGLTYKLIAGFILSTALIGFAAWYAYQNFNKLLGSLETLSAPENSADALQNLINGMHEADGSMRNYIMTNDYTALQFYMNEMGEISTDLEKLKQDPDFENSDETLDSLGEYFQDKADLMYSLVIFKQSSEYEQLNNKALKKISSKVEGSENILKITPELVEVNPGIKQPSLVAPEKETDKSRKEKKKEERKDQKKDEKFLSTLFSSKDKNEPANVRTPTIISLSDTVKTKGSYSALNYDIATNPSVDIEDVRKILREIDIESRRYNTQLSVKELEILASDKILIEKINDVIERIKTDHIYNSEAQLISASKNAKSSSQTMLVIGSAALLVGLFFMGVILIDIKRSNQYKLQLIEARNKAEYLAKAKEEFLANMSHEIRTPLNAIIGFSEQLEATSLQVKQRKFIRAVSNAGSHLLNTVNDILDLSKIEAGKLAIDEHTFIMNDVIEEVASILEIKTEEKGLKIITNCLENTEQLIVGDSFRIKQILFNITGNAIKFTEKGMISINCESIKHKRSIDYRISVKDTGIGIPENKLDTIFESFEQEANSTTRKYGGTGLGLSISKKLTHLLGGTIKVKSKVGEGSDFIISLPMRLASDTEVAYLKTEQSISTNLNGLAILIVDDEPFNLMLAEIILKKYGANISVAANGREALEKIEIQNFDIVLADLQMPEIDGYMLANKIRERYLQVPLIALTANVMQNDLEKIRNNGFNDILLKPYKEKDLIKIIAKYAPVVIGEDDVEQNLILSEKSEQTELFNLSEIKKFADNDNSILVSIIESFVQNNSLSLFTLKDAVKRMDVKTINNTAHKMLPSYNHFHVFEIIGELKKLEIVKEISEEEINMVYSKIEEVSKTLFIKLEEESRSIKMEVV